MSEDQEMVLKSDRRPVFIPLGVVVVVEERGRMALRFLWFSAHSQFQI